MKYLFERLAQHPADATGRAPFDLKAAVLANVQRILANRVAHEDDDVPDVLRCGLPSVVEMAREGVPAIERYGARINALIRHYEPRLIDPRAELEGGGANGWRIVVSAKLARPDGIEEMRFPVTSRSEG